jgi:hypothetical protein
MREIRHLDKLIGETIGLGVVSCNKPTSIALQLISTRLFVTSRAT